MSFNRINNALNWSTGVGSLFGVPIRVHITLLFFLYPVLAYGKANALLSLEIAVGMVASILLHELGHALTAKKFKLGGLSIMLHGFGGFAASRGARTPRQDLLITLAGPAVTFALGGLLWLVGRLGGGEFGSQLWIAYYLGLLNLMMGVLNMIPCLPFDGGQALKAILNCRMTEIKAIRAVAHLGLIVGPIVAVIGFIWQFSSLAVAFGLMGFITCLLTLRDTGGVKFGEYKADREARKQNEAAREREKKKHEAYVEEVWEREKARDEREKLRKLFGESFKND